MLHGLIYAIGTNTAMGLRSFLIHLSQQILCMLISDVEEDLIRSHSDYIDETPNLPCFIECQAGLI